MHGFIYIFYNIHIIKNIPAGYTPFLWYQEERKDVGLGWGGLNGTLAVFVIFELPNSHSIATYKFKCSYL